MVYGNHVIKCQNTVTSRLMSYPSLCFGNLTTDFYINETTMSIEQNNNQEGLTVPRVPTQNKKNSELDEIQTNDVNKAGIDRLEFDNIEDNLSAEPRTETKEEEENNNTPLTNQDKRITNKENEKDDTGLNQDGHAIF